jgi:NADPH2:quinone reductase
MTPDPSTLRAIRYERTGPAREVLHLTTVPRPEPGPGEVRVRLHASGVNPSDVKSRRAPQMSYAAVTPHSDGAGVVEAVGDDVPASRLGERVWTFNAQWKRPFGTAAEAVVLPAAFAVPLPEGVSFEVGACLGIPALTAWEAVHGEDAVDGETVLVQGGAGAVGHLAVQFAAQAGKRVIASVSSADKAALALAAGAEAVVNYREEDVAARIAALTGGRGVDRVIEVNLSANAGSYARVVRPGGRVTVYGSDDWQAVLPLRDYLVHGLSLRFFIVYELDERQRAAGIAGVHAALARGLDVKIAARFGLADTATAHEMVEAGRQVGNVVVLPLD